MDDKIEEFINDVCSAIAEAREKMTPLRRAICDVRVGDIMVKSDNAFWCRYCLKDSGSLLLTNEELERKGKELEVKLIWLLEHAPFSFRRDGATSRN